MPGHRTLRRLMLAVIAAYSMSTTLYLSVQVTSGGTSISTELRVNARMIRAGHLGSEEVRAPRAARPHTIKKVSKVSGPWVVLSLGLAFARPELSVSVARN
jgi:hypothetical protein